MCLEGNREIGLGLIVCLIFNGIFDCWSDCLVSVNNVKCLALDLCDVGRVSFFLPFSFSLIREALRRRRPLSRR